MSTSGLDCGLPKAVEMEFNFGVDFHILANTGAYLSCWRGDVEYFFVVDLPP